MEDRCYRNEYKHIISAETKNMLGQRLGKILKTDPNYPGNSYMVKSLYFDDLYNEALTDKIDGIPIREKFRIRCYNNDFRFIRLEKKVREYNKGYKVSVLINEEEAGNIIKGDVGFLKYSREGLLKEFYVKFITKGLKPVTIIEYERQAFVYSPGNTRVTLDYNIRCSMDRIEFFDRDLPLIAPEQGRCILEVKFDNFLPDLIKNLIAADGTVSSANSKYALGRSIYGIW